MSVAQRFGENLRRAREAADLTQDELGRRASMNRTQIGILERGERLPRIDTLIRLCGALGISPDPLLDGIRWKPGSVMKGEFEEPPSANDE
jgi:transcriptional regulator with XRE-family HTH domain